ncbi:hypothetical protein [Glycomyces arizonensis]|uniref:hypothetical protein n=1 Tax=Glycomyces arizonensis TaxID=256035 RepID=UPI000402B84D|nr:hypothetical protein [Glycomyces arizonensis]
MMPQIVTVRYRKRDGRWRRWFIPVVPVVVLLSPLLLIAVVGGMVVCFCYEISPTDAVRGVGRVLWALPGTRFEMEQGQTAVLVSIR